MKGTSSALYSSYIIDGILMDARPVDMLSQSPVPAGQYDPIVDESLDPPFAADGLDERRVAEYLSLTTKALAKGRGIMPAYATFHTKLIIATSLIATLWREGHFGLADLSVELAWKWDCAPLGNMSAFYRSVEAACEYLDGLGVRITGFSFEEDGRCDLSVGVCLDAAAGEYEGKYEERVAAGMPEDYDDDSDCKSLGLCRKCSFMLGSTDADWVIYLPFDTCDFRLGGSLLSELTSKGGSAPEIIDPDYFMDCYEVVREMVEDGIVKAGITVGTGGLMTCLKTFLPAGMGMDVDLAGIMRGQKSGGVLSVLFSELPGVLIEISDSDYDYIDAEFLLQDVAYFPLGHLLRGKEGLCIVTADSLSGILQALLGSQVSEGED